MRRDITFDQDQLPGVSDITLEVDYEYSEIPPRRDGDPLSCYDGEIESEITLVGNWSQRVMDAYTRAGREACRKIELDLVLGMNFDNMPRKWSEEDRQQG